MTPNYALPPLRSFPLFCLLIVAALSAGPAWARGEFQLPLLNYTNEWRFFTNGTELGTNWYGNNFDDSAWPSGRGLFGFETTPESYTAAPFNTVFIDPQLHFVTNVYFRTHFTLPRNPLQVISLILSNYIDDGAVIYLNGIEVARFRVPAGQNAATFATAGPATEGRHDVAILSAVSDLVREGDNVLAAEVHQLAAESGDIVWGASLTAVLSTDPPLPILIIRQPVSQTLVVGAPLVLSVDIMGTAPKYQWLRTLNGITVPILGATGAIYSVATTSLASGGIYQVRVSNLLNTVFSDQARITIIPDTFGPRLLAASVLETFPFSMSTGTNILHVTLSEPPNTATAANTNNWKITLFGTTNTVPVLSAITFTNTELYFRIGANNWFLGGMSNYVLSARGIKDRVGNVIAPDAQVPIGWPLHRTLIEGDALWNYHTAAFFEPDIFDQPWQQCDFIESDWWAQGYGPLCGGPAFVPTCLGAFQTEIGYQPQPSLFRRSFVWQTDPLIYWPPDSPAQLMISGAFDDGAVFYLNGVEIYRYNLPAAPASLTSMSKALSVIVNPVCTNFTVPVTNLVAGTNWFAAAVFQADNSDDADTVFGVRVTATPYRKFFLAEPPPPLLDASIIEGGWLRLSWTGPGFALESITNLPPSTNRPWMEVTNMSNPFTNSLIAPRQFFRLRK